MKTPLRIAIAGLGTVGAGVIRIMAQHGDMIAARAGRPIEIVVVSARSKGVDRGVDLSSFDWVDDAQDLAKRDDVDVIVELIGGDQGVAADLVRDSLDNAKHVVTANKALVAHHGLDLAQRAEGNHVSLNYEAAVAGGIPIIKSLREGFAGNGIHGVYGILNGTCNYILTQMRETGRDFSDVLADAQALGYAEADPTFDVEGVDAAHKLCILTAIAYGVCPDFDAMNITGISHINATDIAYAQEFGFRIKLLGIARMTDGKIMQVMEPCLVSQDSALGDVEDAFNAVYVDGDFVETALLTGKGAGAGPTASAVVADIVDIARDISVPTFGIPVADLDQAKWVDAGVIRSHYYIRLGVIDKAGVIADITSILKQYNVSIESMVQRKRAPNETVPIIILTHDATRSDIDNVIEKIEKLDSCVEKPCLIRIEAL